MSEPARSGGVAEASFDLLAWRGALARGAPVPSGADLAGWAELLAGAGHAGAAALLERVAALPAGFSPRTVANRRHPFGRAAPAAGDDMAARAEAELQELGASMGSTSSIGPAMVEEIVGDVAATVDRLHHVLELPLADGGSELAAILGALASPARASIDYRAFAAAPLAMLAPAIAAALLTDWARRTRDLWAPPSGSPALLHRAARLDAGGLGPYLTNVGRLARGSRDVVALARIACAAAVAADGAAGGWATPAPWIALLARGCGAGLLGELVDDLGDAGAGDALGAMLTRAASLPAELIDLDLVTRLRDAALDNADYPLAVRAQATVARLRPDSALEGVILGSIQASAGERTAAAATFRGWMARAPDHPELRERLAALEAGRFEPYAVLRGFGSPADRQAARLRRRGLLPHAPRAQGTQIDSVEVH